jgi:hypothetical protein
MLLTLLIGFMPMPVDPDLWFHLAGGERIVATGQVPRGDPFSFTRENAMWVPHSWLFDVGTALSWHHLGPRATEAVMALVFMLTAILSFSLLCGRGVVPLTAAVVCAGLAIAAGNTRGARPQVFSLLLCNVVILLCVQHRHRPRRLLLVAMPVVFLLWAQLHAGCVMGLAGVAAWLGGRCLEALLGTIRRRREGGSNVRAVATGEPPRPTPQDRPGELGVLAGALALSVAAVLLTPHAMTHFEYVRLTMGLSELERTEEWQTPRVLPLTIPDAYLYVLVAVIGVLSARRWRRVGWAELSLCLALMMLAFTGVRHIPLFCIASVPLLANVLGPGRGMRPVKMPWSPRFLMASSFLAGLVLLFFWRFPNDIQARYRKAEPVNGARALAALDRPLQVFTTYNTGSYVLHASPGRLKVFVDSRADVYGDEILRQAREASAGRGWRDLFARWRIDAAVLERTSPLATILWKDADWAVLAQDARSITFVRAATKPCLPGQGAKIPRRFVAGLPEADG